MSESQTHGLVAVPPGGLVPVSVGCPVAGADQVEPREGELAYGFTLPASAAAPAIAHEATEVILDVHRVYALADSALELVRELVTYACRFSGDGQEVHLSLRHRDRVLSLAVYDPHVCHSCPTRRPDRLRQALSVVRRHDGAWGLESGAGTRTWATLLDIPRRWAA
ncbi:MULTISPECIES: ATP-binding protein [Streptomyces]|uniref:ATP-binding protein n=1 Tax=Streptomyces TaxID=1883 RepID=UPI0021CFF459|nr:ATP-binding protein [Streptomyces sp. G-5]MCU4746240.1 ATP-binding protein [Streptomyces sp. G-5]